MSHITKIAAVETTSAIWEYDPDLPNNRILGGSLDVIAAIRTLAVKVIHSSFFSRPYFPLRADPMFWATYRIFRKASNGNWHLYTPRDPPAQQRPLGFCLQYA